MNDLMSTLPRTPEELSLWLLEHSASISQMHSLGSWLCRHTTIGVVKDFGKGSEYERVALQTRNEMFEWAKDFASEYPELFSIYTFRNTNAISINIAKHSIGIVGRSSRPEIYNAFMRSSITRNEYIGTR